MSAAVDEWEICPSFFDEVQVLTKELFNELTGKWRSMYEYSKDFKIMKQDAFLKFLKEAYEEIAQAEEEKIVGMIKAIEKKMYELTKLKKDLQIPGSDGESFGDIGKPHLVLLQEVENRLKEVVELKEERMRKYHALREKEKELCEILEIPALPEFPDPIPNEYQLEDVESHIFNLREERINRVEYFKETKERILELLRIMELDVQNDFEMDIISINEDNYKPTTTNINKLKEKRATLESEYEQKWSLRESLIEKLRRLWRRIDFDEKEGEAFLARWDNVGRTHFQALKDEIARCEEIKLANIKPIVEKLREELIQMWDLLTFTTDQRLEFTPFKSVYVSEDILDLHELEIVKLKMFYEKYRHIYELSEKRNELWERMLHLDEIALDKTRLFNNRGGQLLKEERERKSLEVNLPKVDNQLKKALIEFEQNEGRPFLWHGENLLTKVTDEWTRRQEAKENKKLARKVENQKQIEVEAKLGARLMVQKRKMGTPLANVSEAKARRCDLGQTIVLKSDLIQIVIDGASSGEISDPQLKHLKATKQSCTSYPSIVMALLTENENSTIELRTELNSPDEELDLDSEIYESLADTTSKKDTRKNRSGDSSKKEKLSHSNGHSLSKESTKERLLQSNGHSQPKDPTKERPSQSNSHSHPKEPSKERSSQSQSKESTRERLSQSQGHSQSRESSKERPSQSQGHSQSRESSKGRSSQSHRHSQSRKPAKERPSKSSSASEDETTDPLSTHSQPNLSSQSTSSQPLRLTIIPKLKVSSGSSLPPKVLVLDKQSLVKVCSPHSLVSSSPSKEEDSKTSVSEGLINILKKASRPRILRPPRSAKRPPSPRSLSPPTDSSDMPEHDPAPKPKKSRNEITITPVSGNPGTKSKEDIVCLDDDDGDSGALVIDEGADDIPTCQGCRSKSAQFVCAGCGNQWYCSRECQVSAWEEHSDMCSG